VGDLIISPAWVCPGESEFVYTLISSQSYTTSCYCYLPACLYFFYFFFTNPSDALLLNLVKICGQAQKKKKKKIYPCKKRGANGTYAGSRSFSFFLFRCFLQEIRSCVLYSHPRLVTMVACHNLAHCSNAGVLALPLPPLSSHLLQQR
jgi:hypothetical protein